MGLCTSIWIFLVGSLFIDTVLGNECYQIDPYRDHINNMRIHNDLPVVDNNENVCSTWGNSYINTFDGFFYNVNGNCTYVFVKHCHVLTEDFKILIQRDMRGDKPRLINITIKLLFLIIDASTAGIIVNNKKITIPYKNLNLNIEYVGIDLIFSMNGIIIKWNQDDSLQVELPDKYKNQTCGLCGDFNGLQKYEEDLNDNQESIDNFINSNLAGVPGEVCVHDSTPFSECNTGNTTCENILNGPEFADCVAHFDMKPYLEICKRDTCACRESESQYRFCICTTLNEFSKQCAIAKGIPDNWRRPDICEIICPPTMEYKECGTACEATCSNQEVGTCTNICVTGCFCPNDTVYDDVTDKGCIEPSDCYCKYSGNVYPNGALLVLTCENCSCTDGAWNCTRRPCPGSCSVEGGSHITTFDQRNFKLHGECTYILAQLCPTSFFSVHGEIKSCNHNDFETCLSNIILIIRDLETNLVIGSDGEVTINNQMVHLPYEDGNLTIFEPTSFYIIVHTNFGLQLEIQLNPIMQVYIYISHSYFGETCGLCGNFNDKQIDDYITPNGMSAQNLNIFVNSWRSDQTCEKVPTDVIDPCSINIQKESYASNWCSTLNSRNKVFAACHSVVNPSPYYEKCLYDTCLCKKSEDCLCAVFSSYVRACAERGITLRNWRLHLCDKYIKECQDLMTFKSEVSVCQRTCKSLSGADASCNVKFIPIDGCVCKDDLYMTEYGECVSNSSCPCYHLGIYHSPGEKLHKNGRECVCKNGRIHCEHKGTQTRNCTAPMFFFNCSLEPLGSTGIECLQSCHALNVDCYSSECVSGCVCPTNMLEDGKGGCVSSDKCTCTYNDKVYNHMEQTKIGCKMCTCNNRKWVCDDTGVIAQCAVYGEGNYITFDNRPYRYSGQCEYTLVQDFCGVNVKNGTFRVISENVQCGTDSTCSKSIRVVLDDYVLLLRDGDMELKNEGGVLESPFQVRNTSLYLIVKARNGMILIWDKKTSLTIKISENFQSNVCGLCGNYDGNSINDFNTRGHFTVEDVIEFGNSWKLSSTCPEVKTMIEPCEINPHRKSWAQRHCSIILGKSFRPCHSEVDPHSYYDACVKDSCACDEGGDCDCFCTAIAVYAQTCLSHCICVEWRTPNRCPVFCDYYNQEGKCEWHYKACGVNCIKTCRNKAGNCTTELPKVEGCYPSCPQNKPYFEEISMECVAECGCYDHMGKYYNLGEKIISCKTCETCECTRKGIKCIYDENACYCKYNGKIYSYKETIYNIYLGNGMCSNATCEINGTIKKEKYACATRTTTAITVTSHTTKQTARTSTIKSTTGTVTSRTVTPFTSTPKSTTSRVTPTSKKVTPHTTIRTSTTSTVKPTTGTVTSKTVTPFTSTTKLTTSKITTSTRSATTSTVKPTTGTVTSKTVTPFTSTPKLTTSKITTSTRTATTSTVKPTTGTVTSKTVTPFTSTPKSTTSTVTPTSKIVTPHTTIRTSTTSTVKPSTGTVTSKTVTPFTSTTKLTTSKITTSTRSATTSTVKPTTGTVTTKTVTPFTSTSKSTTSAVTPTSRTVTPHTTIKISTTSTVKPTTGTVTSKTVTPFTSTPKLTTSKITTSTRSATTSTVKPTTGTVTSKTVTPFTSTTKLTTSKITTSTRSATTSTVKPSTGTVTSKTVTPFTSTTKLTTSKITTSTRTATTITVKPTTGTVTSKTVTPFTSTPKLTTSKITTSTRTATTSTVKPSTGTVTSKTVTPFTSTPKLTTSKITTSTRTATTSTVKPSTGTVTSKTVTPFTSTTKLTTSKITTSTRTATTSTVKPSTGTVTSKTVTSITSTPKSTTSKITTSTGTATTSTVKPTTGTVTTKTVTPFTSTSKSTTSAVTPTSRTVTPHTTIKISTTSTVKPTTGTVTSKTVTPFTSTPKLTTSKITTSTRTATTSTVKPSTGTVTSKTVTPFTSTTKLTTSKITTSTRTATTSTVKPTTGTGTSKTVTPFTSTTKLTTSKITTSTRTATTSTVKPTPGTVTTKTVTPFTSTSKSTTSTVTPTSRTVTPHTTIKISTTSTVKPTTGTVTSKTVTPFTSTTKLTTSKITTSTRSATTSTVKPSTGTVTSKTVTPFTSTPKLTTSKITTSTRTATTSTVKPSTGTVTSKTVTPFTSTPKLTTSKITTSTRTATTSTVKPTTGTVTSKTVTSITSTPKSTTSKITTSTGTATTSTVKQSTGTVTSKTVTPFTSTTKLTTSKITTSTRTATTITVKPTTGTVTSKTVTPFTSTPKLTTSKITTSTRSATTSTVKPSTGTVTSKTVTPFTSTPKLTTSKITTSTRSATTSTVKPSTGTVTSKTVTPFTSTPKLTTSKITTSTRSATTITVKPSTGTVTSKTVTPFTSTPKLTTSKITTSTRSATTSTVKPSTGTVTSKTVTPLTSTPKLTTSKITTSTRTATTSTVKPTTGTVTSKTVTTFTTTPKSTTSAVTTSTRTASTSTVKPTTGTVTSKTVTPSISTQTSTISTMPPSSRTVTPTIATLKSTTPGTSISSTPFSTTESTSSTKITTLTSLTEIPSTSGTPFKDHTRVTTQVTVPPCEIPCKEGSMLNITELDCKPKRVRGTCNSPTRIYDDKHCCFYYECQYCVGYNGQHYAIGETWEGSCEECSCLENATISCEHVTCENIIPDTCNLPGYVQLTFVSPDNPCCTVSKCFCIPDLCIKPQFSCSIGLTPEYQMDGCCVNVTCVPKGVCVDGNMEYLPGSILPSPPGSCQECTCSDIYNSTINQNTVECMQITCNETCEEGKNYTLSPDQCCGNCIEKSCIIEMPTGDIEVIPDGHSSSPIDNNCTIYRCSRQPNGELYINVTQMICEYNSDNDCGPGRKYQHPTDKCCGQCVQIYCVLSLGSENITLLAENQTISSPNDNCISFACVKFMDKLITVIIMQSCEYQNSEDCGYGQEYIPPSDHCCGHCVQTSCAFVSPSGVNILLKEDKTWHSEDNCTKYTCTKIENKLFTRETHQACMYASQEDCGFGETFDIIAGQCCGNCTKTSCIYTDVNGKPQLLPVNQTMIETEDICISYSCKKINGLLSTIVSKETCEYPSADYCQDGEEYNINPGQCCGQCVHKSCLFREPDGQNRTIMVGDLWTPENDTCVSYGCALLYGQLYISALHKVCEIINPEDCESGKIEMGPGGCCQLCKAPKNCRLEFHNILLQKDDCKLKLNIPYCTGICMNNTMADVTPLSSPMECMCCGIQSSNTKEVQLQCDNGSLIPYEYEHIESCGCNNRQCN